MMKIVILCFSIILLSNITIYAQKERKVNYYLSLQFDKTLYDYQIKNNKGGGGLGIELYFKTKTLLEPTLELNADLIGKGESLAYITGSNSKIYRTKSIISSTFLGSVFKISPQFNFIATVGTSFFNHKAHLGVRTSVIWYPSTSQKWDIKSSLTHVFINNEFTQQDFGYLSLSIGINLSK